MQGKIKGLAHIGVNVSDIDRSIAFYEKLGFTVGIREQTQIRLAMLHAGSCVIELLERSADSMQAYGRGLVDHIAVEVEDIDGTVATAIAAGIPIDPAKVMTMSAFGGIRNVFFAGPDGESLEFFEFIK